ncbi:phosphoribosyltransferase [Myxococcota bacterium]|nr:phosphoribosyltransferase [Myxococcota bacterium]
MRFRDREDAGRRLAALLSPRDIPDPMVLALPRGGVPVGFEVARALGAEMDVLVARKLGAPWEPELGIGAIAEGGGRYLDLGTIDTLGISDADIEEATAREEEELARRVRRYRGGLPPPDVRGRTVILVDDGIATGGTVRAAVRSLGELGAGRVVLAVPVAAPQTLARLLAEVDEVVCVYQPPELIAIGLWYQDFRQVTDEEVLDLLARVRRPSPPPMCVGPDSGAQPPGG